MLPVTDKHVTKPSSSPTMHPTFWKVLSILLLLSLLVQQFNWKSTELSAFIPSTPKPDVDWVYQWRRDSNNHGLSAEQCDAAFPELYSEIERAQKHWAGRTIQPQDIELYKANDGGVRVLIVNQQIRVIQTKGLRRNDFRHRIIAVLQQLQRAITATEHTGEKVPDIEFTIVMDDIPVLAGQFEEPGALWAFTRNYGNTRHDNIWVAPDFHFWAAPPEAEAWQVIQASARKHDSPLDAKIPQLIWRGVRWTNPEIREALINVTKDQSWADVKYIDWTKTDDKMPMTDFCKYRYTVNTEGRSWSARLTALLNCDSLLLIHDVEWIAHYYHLLDTGVNCVRVDRDFSDLHERITYYNEHISEAQVIADTARNTFRQRYTSPAATACYWRKLMHAWASRAFVPEVTETENAHIGESHRSSSGLRGISLEEFIVHDNTRDYPYHLKPKQKGKPAQGKPQALNGP